MTELHPRVRDSLARVGSAVTVHDHALLDREVRSPADFAAALAYPLDRITKSVFLAARGGAYAVAVCAMPRKLDFPALSAALAQAGRMQVAEPDALEATLGYPRNGVSPLGVPSGVAVVLDDELLRWPTVLIGGGATGVEVEIAPEELVRLSGAVVARISKSG